MKKTQRAVAAILGFGLVSAHLLHGQTFVSGNISGTWSPSGNPYIVSDNANVPVSQTLTIQPGVVVWIGSGVTITVTGTIQAVGTTSQRITFQAPIGAEYWNQIYLNNAYVTNLFKCCDFLNATNALVMGNNSTKNFVTKILNCTFSNCLSSAIYGEDGDVGVGYSPVIKNCLFSASLNACVLGGTYYSFNPPNPLISANIFQNLSGTALWLQGDLPNAGTAAIIINNTFVNCAGGVRVTDPWNATIQSCVFKGCASAITVSGSQSRTVTYNDFFSNGTNFVGYPSTYGTPIILNRNGTSCDLLYNIFQNPQFASATDFHLQGTSPCIDAGEGSAANFDNSFPPSLGTVTNDIGAYGGPNAGQWVVPAPSNFLTLAAARYIGVTINPPSAGHYELDYASALAGTNNWIQITNMDLSAPFLYTEPALSPARFYRAEKLY